MADKTESIDRQRTKAPSSFFVKTTIRELRTRARQGDAEAAARLNEWLAGYPEHGEQDTAVASLTSRVEQALITALAGQDLIEFNRLRRDMDAVKSELITPNAGVLERALAEGVTLSLFAMQRASLLAMQPSPDPAVNHLRDRQLTTAQNRFHAAVRSWELFTRKKMEIDRKACKGLQPTGSRYKSASRLQRRTPRRESSRIKL